MLYCVGGVVFEAVAPNVHDVTIGGQADYVQKAVVGGPKPLEFVGDGTTTMKLLGKLFPIKVGGLSEISILWALKATGLPQIVLRGDGVPLGWYAITHLQEHHTYLAPNGVGQVVDFEIELTLDPEGPFSGSFFDIIGGFL